MGINGIEFHPGYHQTLGPFHFFFFFQINYETYPKLYWSVYPHRSRESLSPVCGILKTCFHLSRWNARVSCQRYQSILERKHCHNLKPFFLHNLMYKQIHRANFFCVSVTIQQSILVFFLTNWRQYLMVFQKMIPFQC